MLEEIFKKESFNEEDMKIIIKNLANLTHEQKVRLGFEAPAPVAEVVVEEKPQKVTRAKKKVV
jgi:hypothetical protein